MAEKTTNIILKGVDKLSPVFKAVSSRFDSLSNSVKSIHSRFALFNEQNKQINKTLKNMGKGISSFGKTMSIGVTAPVVAAGAASIKAFADFDNGMRMTLNNLDETSFGTMSLSEGFKQMTADVLDLAKKSPASLASLNKSLFDTVSAGIPAAGAMKVVASANKLAVAGITDVAIATDGMTSALNGFQISADKADAVSAKFFVAQKFGKTTIEELASDIGKVAPLAASMGVSFEEVLAAVSAGTVAGIKSNEAFTSMKAVLANVVKPTETAQQAAKALGIEFNSTALRSKGFVDFMGDIIKNSKRIGVDPALAFEKLFGSVEALNFASAIGGKQHALFKNILGELTNETKLATDFQKAFENQNSSLSNRIEILKNRFVVAGVAIGERLAPAIETLSEKLSNLFNFLEQNPAIAELAGMMAIAAAAIGPMLIGFGSFLAMLPAIMAGAKVLGGILATVFGVFASGPVLIGAAIAALIAGGVLLVKNWETVSNFFGKIWDKIKEVFSGGAKFVGSTISTLFPKLLGTDLGVTVNQPTVQTPGVTQNERTAPAFGEEITAPGPVTSINEKRSKVDIEIISAPGVKAKVSADSNDDDLNINTGFQGAASF